MPEQTRARLRRLVGTVVLLAVGLQLVVGLALRGDGAVAPLQPGVSPSWLAPAVLAGLLLALVVAADLYAVRIRHGEEAEELTLAEAALVVCALLLPPTVALLLSVGASVLCSLIRRREPVKLLFNAAVFGAGSALLLASVHAVSSPAAGVTPTTVAGLLLGMTAFTAVNLVAVARVMALVSDDDSQQVVSDGLRLSIVMALGTTGLGATAVTLASAAPALLPFSVLPAAALTFAYRAAAQESEERQRSSRLLALSQMLAGRLDEEEVLTGFLRLARQAFGADVAVAVLDGEHGEPSCALDDRTTGTDRRAASPAELGLLRRAGTGADVLADAGAHGWTRALLAPLEADGRRLGAVVLATRDRHRSLGAAELTLLTPLASALAVALRGAAHLRLLTEESSKLQAVVDRSSDGILVLDGDGIVQLWSPAVTALTGLGPADALGTRLGALLETSGSDGTPVDAFFAGRVLLVPDSSTATVELVLRRADGETRVVRCAHAGVFDEAGTLERDVVLLHDVTRERQVERLKADFIATVSHELRTPVTPIKGYADLLRRRGDAMTPERRRECLDVISDRSAHLARLVEDLLLASRISASEGVSHTSVAVGRHDLGALVVRACGDFGDDGERIVVVRPDSPVEVACDPLRTVQVLGNLVGNGLKYSATYAPVRVRVLLADGEARVEVSDIGRGIPSDQLEKVFEKFHRVEDPMRMTTGGTGLGLYIARQLTTAMGGQLTCSSVLGGGSTFVLRLPTEVPTRPVVSEPSGAVPAPRRTSPRVGAPPRPALRAEDARP